MEIKKIGVVGAGTMGNGIAQVAAQIGCEVVMRDIQDSFVDRGIKSIDKFLAKSVEKGKLQAAEKDKIMGRIKGTTKLADLKDVDYVVRKLSFQPTLHPCQSRKSLQRPRDLTRFAECTSLTRSLS
jgi:3-hydroxyacyl-CoA dehydrogenase